MKNIHREVVVVLRNGSMSEEAIDQEVESIHRMLEASESMELFCRVNELADRFRITGKPRKIKKELKYQDLRPFRFLICKN